MTLHEAIEKVLIQNKKAMTTIEIATTLNHNKWYKKKNKSEITPYQIHGRTRNYSHIFDRNGSTVILKKQINIKETTTKEVKQTIKTEATNKNVKLLEKDLLNLEDYKKASEIDKIVPDVAGLYCIRISNIDTLPSPFNEIIKKRNHNIVYVGLASKSLKKRFLNQELRARGHGTFFRSLGAILGYKPLKGSLIGKANTRNYKFEKASEKLIIKWINDNLIVNWVEYDGDFKAIETQIITNNLPLINLANNPIALKEISDLRAECVMIANNV